MILQFPECEECKGKRATSFEVSPYCELKICQPKIDEIVAETGYSIFCGPPLCYFERNTG